MRAFFKIPTILANPGSCISSSTIKEERFFSFSFYFFDYLNHLIGNIWSMEMGRREWDDSSGRHIYERNIENYGSVQKQEIRERKISSKRIY